jgi:AraC family transcriptional regulator, regulatory protein of adaptative response / methylphosphotriester-DNA alkyltransferase methyltransferase
LGLLNENIMWEAVISCNQVYDTQFIYAVRSTSICCLPSCKSKTPLRENVSFYPSLSLAIEDGFRPCKRCRPDVILSNEEEIIMNTKKFIVDEYRSSLTLDRIALSVGVSKYHLQRVFKRHTGRSPLEYVTELRMQEALLKLRSTNHSITEIAHELGYKSSAHFATVFRRQFGCTPTEYRNRRVDYED